MKYSKKIAALGVSVMTMASVAFVSPVAAAEQKEQMLQVGSQQNAAVDVATELNCSYHTLTAKVTNKTDSKITPDVTFNTKEPTFPSNTPIDPGKTRSYTYDFSNNNFTIDVKVMVDTYDDLTLSPMVSCSEPVTFTAQATSEGAITGILRNNSTLVSQVALTQVGSGDVRVENLGPGESRLIALPFTALNGQEFASVTIGTTAGYQGLYTVELNKSTIIPY